MTTIDFLIGAIRASQDLHPNVKTELEEILHRAEPVEPKKARGYTPPLYVHYEFECSGCSAIILKDQPFCCGCGKPVSWT